MNARFEGITIQASSFFEMDSFIQLNAIAGVSEKGRVTWCSSTSDTGGHR